MADWVMLRIFSFLKKLMLRISFKSQNLNNTYRSLLMWFLKDYGYTKAITKMWRYNLNRHIIVLHIYLDWCIGINSGNNYIVIECVLYNWHMAIYLSLYIGYLPLYICIFKLCIYIYIICTYIHFLFYIDKRET
jgi:hypothetical protein